MNEFYNSVLVGYIMKQLIIWSSGNILYCSLCIQEFKTLWNILTYRVFLFVNTLGEIYNILQFFISLRKNSFLAQQTISHVLTEMKHSMITFLYFHLKQNILSKQLKDIQIQFHLKHLIQYKII